MEKSIIQSPVRIIIWSRGECLKQQFDVIKKVKPRIIFLQSDGGRDNDEQEQINKNRLYIESEINWECEVHKIYSDINKGFYASLKIVEDYIWSMVDRCIFLEDDTLPTEAFFFFCEELLEKYKDDTRIECICGMNHLGIYDVCDSDYFFSRQGSIWGTATWKRTYQNRKRDYYNSEYSMKLLRQLTGKNKKAWKRMVGYGKGEIVENHPAGDEFWIEFDMYAQSQLQIVPKYNLTKNIGYDGIGLNTPKSNTLAKGDRQVYNMQTYEIEFPLKHPQFVIADSFYEKKRNRIMGYNMPLVSVYRRIVHILKELCWGDKKYLIKKLNRKVQR